MGSSQKTRVCRGKDRPEFNFFYPKLVLYHWSHDHETINASVKIRIPAGIRLFLMDLAFIKTISFGPYKTDQRSINAKVAVLEIQLLTIN